MNLYEVLGVDPKATQAEIKKAYRKIMSACHPDREGADEDRAKKTNEAYEVLSDEKRRARYDATGKVDVEPTTDVQSKQIIRSIFTEHLNRFITSESEADPYARIFREVVPPTIPNFHASICNEITKQLNNLDLAEKLNDNLTKKLNKILNNVLSKTEEPDSVFNPILEERIQQAEKLAKDIEVKRGLYQAALKLMQEGFKYNAPPKEDTAYTSEKLNNARLFIGNLTT